MNQTKDRNETSVVERIIQRLDEKLQGQHSEDVGLQLLNSYFPNWEDFGEETDILIQRLEENEKNFQNQVKTTSTTFIRFFW